VLERKKYKRKQTKGGYCKIQLLKTVVKLLNEEFDHFVGLNCLLPKSILKSKS
jgi:hypothetical protein